MDENIPKDAPIGVIPVDAITQIKKVAYKVEKYSGRSEN